MEQMSLFDMGSSDGRGKAYMLRIRLPAGSVRKPWRSLWDRSIWSEKGRSCAV